MRKWVYAVAAVLLVSGASAYVYEVSGVNVIVRHEKRCGEQSHKGDNLISVENSQMMVPRWQAGSLGVQEERVTCGTCLSEKEKREAEERARVAEAARLAKEEAEASALLANLEIEFGFEGSARLKEQSISPGGKCWFEVEVKNHGSEPVSGLKFVVGPEKYLELDYSSYSQDWLRGETWGNQVDQRPLIKAAFRRLTKTGVLINSGVWGEKANPVINPYNSPYYKSETAGWGNPYNRTNSEGCLREGCVLSRRLTPGQDVTFTGYLIIKNRKLAVGTITCHVMHPY